MDKCKTTDRIQLEIFSKPYFYLSANYQHTCPPKGGERSIFVRISYVTFIFLLYMKKKYFEFLFVGTFSVQYTFLLFETHFTLFLIIMAKKWPVEAKV